MIAIAVQHVTKLFVLQTVIRAPTLKTALTDFVHGRRDPRPSHRALDDVSFAVVRGETFGLVGRNGSGKSTLLRVIAGIYRPDQGSVVTRGRIASLLELGAGFHQDFTGRENIFVEGAILGLSKREIEHRYDEIVAFADLGEYIDQPVRTYSSGMFMRLAFSVAVHVDPEILLIDEVLAVGDEQFVRKCETRLEQFRSAGKTVVLVSHDLAAVERWCDRALWLEGGRVRGVGSTMDVVQEYHAAMLAESLTDPSRAGAPANQEARP